MTEHPSPQALVSHDCPLLSAGIAAAVAPCCQVSTCARTELGPALARRRFELVISGHAEALDGLSQTPGLRWLVVAEAEHRGEAVRQALAAGALGYLDVQCSVDELQRAALAVAAGRRYLCSRAASVVADTLGQAPLTPREREVLCQLCQGLDNKSIALRLDLACGTVKTHVKALLQKLGARSRTQAVAEAHRLGLIDMRCGALATQRGPRPTGRAEGLRPAA